MHCDVNAIIHKISNRDALKSVKFLLVEFFFIFSVPTLGRKTTIKEDKKTIKATVAMVRFAPRSLNSDH